MSGYLSVRHAIGFGALSWADELEGGHRGTWEIVRAL